MQVPGIHPIGLGLQCSSSNSGASSRAHVHQCDNHQLFACHSTHCIQVAGMNGHCSELGGSERAESSGRSRHLNFTTSFVQKLSDVPGTSPSPPRFYSLVHCLTHRFTQGECINTKRVPAGWGVPYQERGVSVSENISGVWASEVPLPRSAGMFQPPRSTLTLKSPRTSKLQSSFTPDSRRDSKAARCDEIDHRGSSVQFSICGVCAEGMRRKTCKSFEQPGEKILLINKPKVGESGQQGPLGGNTFFLQEIFQIFKPNGTNL